MTGENLGYINENPLEVLIDFIIGYGDPDKRDRTNIFSKDWEMHGSFSGKHLKYNVMICQNFAAGSAKVNTSPVKAPR